MSVELTSEESSLFGVLLENCPSNVVLRVAGGWVRDKLLNKTSPDIDIVVAGMDKVENFARAVQESLRKKGEPVKEMAIMVWGLCCGSGFVAHLCFPTGCRS